MNHENFEENQGGITAFMQLVEEISDPSARKSVAEGATDLGATGIPPKLVAALNAMSEDELRFLARLKADLDCVNFFDELDDGKLYYL